MTKTTRLIHVDYQELLQHTLPDALASASEFRITHSASNGFEALELMRKEPCDLMLLEPRLPDKDGIDLVKELLNHHAGLRILILTIDETPTHAYRMLRAGAAGWLPKTSPLKDLIQALRTVTTDKTFLPGKLKSVFAERYVHPEGDGDPKERLTDREYQVARLLALGHNNHEIAEKLFIGVKTVDTHRANMLRKLDLRNNSDVTRFAIQHQLIEI